MIIQFKHHTINSRLAQQLFCCWEYVKHLHLWYLVPFPGLKYLAKRNQFLPENLQAYSLPCHDFILCFKSNFCYFFFVWGREKVVIWITTSQDNLCILNLNTYWKFKCLFVRKQKWMGCREGGLITLADHTNPCGWIQAITCLTWLGKLQILKTALTPAISWIQHGLCVWVKLMGLTASCKACLMQEECMILRNRLVKCPQRAHAESSPDVPVGQEMDDFYLSPTEFPSLRPITWAAHWVGRMCRKSIPLQLQQKFQLLSHRSQYIFEGWQAPSLPIFLFPFLQWRIVTTEYKFTHRKSLVFLSGIMQYMERSLFHIHFIIWSWP